MIKVDFRFVCYTRYTECAHCILLWKKDSRVIISTTVRCPHCRFPEDVGRGFRSVPKRSSVVLLTCARPCPIGRNERMLYVTNRWIAGQSARQIYIVTVCPMLKPTDIGLLGGIFVCTFGFTSGWRYKQTDLCSFFRTKTKGREKLSRYWVQVICITLIGKPHRCRRLRFSTVKYP